jgi:hypothetical protein
MKSIDVKPTIETPNFNGCICNKVYIGVIDSDILKMKEMGYETLL